MELFRFCFLSLCCFSHFGIFFSGWQFMVLTWNISPEKQTWQSEENSRYRVCVFYTFLVLLSGCWGWLQVFWKTKGMSSKFGLWRHCELNSLITSVLNKNIYRPVTHVIFTSHKSRRHVHAQSPNQPNVWTDKSLQQKTNGWGHNSISFIDHYRIYWNSVFFFSLHFYRLFLSNLIRTDTEGEDRNDICFQWRV